MVTNNAWPQDSPEDMEAGWNLPMYHPRGREEGRDFLGWNEHLIALLSVPFYLIHILGLSYKIIVQNFEELFVYTHIYM